MFFKKIFRMLLNERGAVGDPPAPESKKIEFTPEQQSAVDGIVKERLARERERYKDYDDLRKYRDETERAKSEQGQKELENQKKYEEAKANLEKQLKSLQDEISKRDGKISDLQITHALSTSISAENGYVEETMALLKSLATITPEGVVGIKIKNDLGIEETKPVSDGVKWFLKQRPHLVKSNARGGGNTPPGNPQAGGGEGTEDLTSLNEQLQEAIASGDNKRAKELRVKVNAALQKKGVRRTL